MKPVYIEIMRVVMVLVILVSYASWWWHPGAASQ